MSSHRWQCVSEGLGREWHFVVGMTGHMPFYLSLGKWKKLMGPIVRTPYEILTAHSFLTLLHLTDSSHASVSLVTRLSPISHVRRAFVSLPYLVAWVWYSMLSYLLLVRFEILHTILPHAIKSITVSLQTS